MSEYDCDWRYRPLLIGADAWDSAQSAGGRPQLGIDGFAAQMIPFPADSVTVEVPANSDVGPLTLRSIARRLGFTGGELLFFHSDGTDYFCDVRDGVCRVVALDYHGDGMPTPRRETRLPGRATPK